MVRPTRTQVDELERRRLQVPGGAPQSFYRPARPPRGVEGGVDFSALSKSLSGLVKTFQKNEAEMDKDEYEKGRIEAEANRSKSIKDWSRIDPEANVYRSIGSLEMTGGYMADIYKSQLDALKDEAIQLDGEPDENGIPRRKMSPDEILTKAWEATAKKFTDAGREDLLDNFYFRKGFSSRRRAVEDNFLAEIEAGYDKNLKKRVNNQFSAKAATMIKAGHHSAERENGGMEFDENSKKALQDLLTNAAESGVTDVAGVAFGSLVTVVNEVAEEQGLDQAQAVLDFYSTVEVGGVPLNRHTDTNTKLSTLQRTLSKEEEDDIGKEVRTKAAQLKGVVQDFWGSPHAEVLNKARTQGDQAYLDALVEVDKLIAQDPQYAPDGVKAIRDSIADEIVATRRSPSPSNNPITTFYKHLNSGELSAAQEQIRFLPPEQQVTLYQVLRERRTLQRETNGSRVFNNFMRDIRSIEEDLGKEFKHFTLDERDKITDLLNTTIIDLEQQYVSEASKAKKTGMSPVEDDDHMSKWVREKMGEIKEARSTVVADWIKPRRDVYNRIFAKSLTGEDPTKDPDFNKLPEGEQNKIRQTAGTMVLDRTNRVDKEITTFAVEATRAMGVSQNPDLVELRIKSAGPDEGEKLSAAQELLLRENTFKDAFAADLKGWLQEPETQKMNFDEFIRALEVKKGELRDKLFLQIKGPSDKATEDATRRGESPAELTEAQAFQSAFMRSLQDGSLGQPFIIAGKTVPLFMKHETAEWLFSRELRVQTGTKEVYDSSLLGGAWHTEPVYTTPTSFTKSIVEMYQADTPEARERSRSKVLYDRGVVLGAIIKNPMNATFLRNTTSRKRGLRKTWNVVARHTGISVDQILNGSVDVKINGKNHVIPVDMNYVEPAITPMFLDEKGRPSIEVMEGFVEGVRDGNQATITQAKRLMDKLNWPYDKTSGNIHNDSGFKTLIQSQGFAIKNVTGGR